MATNLRRWERQTLMKGQLATGVCDQKHLVTLPLDFFLCQRSLRLRARLMTPLESQRTKIVTMERAEPLKLNTQTQLYGSSSALELIVCSLRHSDGI